jgi:hypothetical protein
VAGCGGTTNCLIIVLSQAAAARRQGLSLRACIEAASTTAGLAVAPYVEALQLSSQCRQAKYFAANSALSQPTAARFFLSQLLHQLLTECPWRRHTLPQLSFRLRCVQPLGRCGLQTAQHKSAQYTQPLGPGTVSVTWLLYALLLGVAAALLPSCPERCKQTVAHKRSCAARRADARWSWVEPPAMSVKDVSAKLTCTARPTRARSSLSRWSTEPGHYMA